MREQCTFAAMVTQIVACMATWHDVIGASVKEATLFLLRCIFLANHVSVRSPNIGGLSIARGAALREKLTF